MSDKEIVERLYDLWLATEDYEMSRLLHAAAERLEELTGCDDSCPIEGVDEDA